MTQPRGLDRLTAQDLLMLWPDDFGWSDDIGVLAILDGTRLLDPDGRVRIEDLRRELEPRLALVPRFRQLLYRPRRGLGWPLWVDAQSFDLAEHLRVQPLGGPGDETQLLQVCAALNGRRLDRSWPLWLAWLLPGLPEQQVGLFLRAHHTIADGVAGMAAFGALLDLTADAPTPVTPPWTPTPIPSAGELLGDNLRRRLRGLHRGLSGLTIPPGHHRPRPPPGGSSSPNVRPAPASTAPSAPTGDWPSSAAASRWPSRSPTPTKPRSTTWSWPPWPAACASSWPAAARTSTGWCCE